MKLYKSAAWLRKRRVTDGKTVEEMAREAGCEPMTIRRELKKVGLK